MTGPPQDIYKIVIIGDSCVGKTSLAIRICRNVFNAHYKATYGFDLFSVEMDVGDRKVAFNIVDTAGQERHLSVAPNFYRGSDAVLLCFDVTNDKTFDRIDWWKNNFITLANPQSPENFPFFLVGTKIDLENRTVDMDKCKQWCELNNDAPFFATSSKSDIGVKELFRSVAEHISKNRPHESNRSHLKIPDIFKSEPDIRPKSGCC
ncbi:GTP-binding protein yptV5 [Thelohanellus kitauei]|uniref:GTP-binding protein yptV5 n=1 Tax=Thelohanellus kitauei TaxID=669202 RepID=A0A0C2JYS7_THEKT|nr:GTP-binding protein yptV5 [Thelohanellus kitauei]